MPGARRALPTTASITEPMSVGALAEATWTLYLAFSRPRESVRPRFTGRLNPLRAGKARNYAGDVPAVNTLAIFAAAVVVFAVVPGPAVFYIVTRSVSQGRRAGFVSAAAVATGTLVHVAAATAGLSALLVSSSLAFSVVKYLGAGYLVYLGLRTLLRRERVESHATPVGQPLRKVYREGVVVAVLNPKTALFFLAFLPQFVEPTRGPVALQLAVLGVMVVVIAFVSDSSYALITGSAGAWLRSRARLLSRGRVVTGGAYIMLGVTAAVAGERPQPG